jgi:hypothetical protein
MLIINIIQSMLAPGLMISACGLLLLGMNNKYSLVVSRIRALNEEKRKFFIKARDQGLQYEDEIRINSLGTQLQLLHARAKMVRNAVLFYSLAVGVFVLTSLIIGLAFAVKLEYLEPVIIACFSLGMIQVLIGIGYAAMETLKGYQIISYEIKVDE